MSATTSDCDRPRSGTADAHDLFGLPNVPELDRLAGLAAQLLAAPIGLVSLIGRDEQWFVGRYGLTVNSVPTMLSFCRLTAGLDAPLVIRDTIVDPRVRASPLVTAEPGVRFYAGAPLYGSDGTHLGALCVIDTVPRDCFSEEEARLLSRLAEFVLAALEERREARPRRAIGSFAAATALALITADQDGRISFWNDAAERIFGHSAEAAIGRPLDIIVPDRFRQAHRGGLARLAAGGQPKLAGKTTEVVARHRDGREFPIELSVAAWQGPRGFEFGAHVQDISERRARESRLQHLADHDPLTGLTNRAAFLDRVEALLDERGTATLLAIDLDGFKSVNDTFGHPIGDALLQAIAIRLTGLADTGDVLGRTGGDEFALLLARGDDPGMAKLAASAMVHAFQEPFRIAGHALQIGISVGIAEAPAGGIEADELLLRADLALLAAKRDGGRVARMFDAGMSNALAVRRLFKDEVRVATERGEWTLFYQPQIRLADGALIGVEALLRWRHPTRGLLAPAAFLDVLETHPVAYEVGCWVIEEACRQLAAWRGGGWEVPRISVNLFAAQFSAGTLEQVVSAALEQHALSPSDLEIEVTETIALRPDDQIPATLKRLRAAGVHIAFDDFGTGFASLTTLKQLPVSRLKIDKSFVQDLCEAPHSQAIVGAIVSLAGRLGLEVVAEGIETEAQRAMLQALGCEAGQGYLLGRPIAPGQEDPRRMLAA